MIRRTRGIGQPAQQRRGHSVPLRENTPEERTTARRAVASHATDADDLRQLLDALDLNEEAPDA